MFSMKEMPTASSLFQTYASMTGSVMLFRTLANDIIPYPLRGYITTLFRNYFKPKPSQLTLVIEDTSTFGRNQVYDAAEIYLSTKLTSDTERLRITKSPKEKNITIRLEQGEKIVDIFDGVELKWKFLCSDQPEKPNDSRNLPFSSQTMDRMRYFELTFHKRNKDIVLNSYVPFVLERAKDMKDQQRILKMHTLNTSHGCGLKWDSVNLEHPSTFDTLAMDHELKNALIDDLDRFVRRKEFYKKVGKAWKRGYLLYGPPGTGKSSLVAAIANYLKFDLYDLQLANIMRDSDLRRLLLTTGNRSVLVIEDIDCSVDFPDRRHGDGRKQPDPQLTLSGLLNFIDGLWSSCGDERIIVFTTNHKERLDPALLRPGRMDMHINMSYCTYHGFKLLASNYLGICENHRLFKEIEGLLDSAEVTPAQVAEELMKSEHADIALEGFVNLLKRKKMEGSELEDDNANEVGILETKRRKIEKKPSRPVRITTKRKTTRKCRK